MLLRRLSSYLTEVGAALQVLNDCHFERYQEEILTPQRVNLRVRIRFSNGALLEINEAIVGDNKDLRHLTYRYHLQDKGNKLIFRYDNTPHFHSLATFPHHKHTPTEVVASEKPEITEVIDEVKEYLLT
jgi:hypothetical protein